MTWDTARVGLVEETGFRLPAPRVRLDPSLSQPEPGRGQRLSAPVRNLGGPQPFGVPARQQALECGGGPDERLDSNTLGAGEGTRTLDINLGKVALYQLSYARMDLTAKRKILYLGLRTVYGYFNRI